MIGVTTIRSVHEWCSLFGDAERDDACACLDVSSEVVVGDEEEEPAALGGVACDLCDGGPDGHALEVADAEEGDICEVVEE